MSRSYWLDLFTGKTWEEFLANGATVTGFRERRKKTVEKIMPGDYLLCYLTGLSRFIGILEVLSKCFVNDTPIWKEEAFPYRLKVKLLYKLEPETAVPVHELKDRLTIFHNAKPRYWSGFFRGSPAKFGPKDGEIIAEAIKYAFNNPIKREYDEKNTGVLQKRINPNWVRLLSPKEKRNMKRKNCQKKKHPMRKFNGYCLILQRNFRRYIKM